MNEKSVKLAIKENNYCSNAVCAICDKWTDLKVPIPFAIFLADDYSPVCYDCAGRINPHLQVMLNDWYDNHLKEY